MPLTCRSSRLASWRSRAAKNVSGSPLDFSPGKGPCVTFTDEGAGFMAAFPLLKASDPRLAHSHNLLCNWHLSDQMQPITEQRNATKQQPNTSSCTLQWPNHPGFIHIVGCKETATLFHQQMRNYHEFTHIDEPAKGVQLCVVIAITQPLLHEQGKKCTVLQGPHSLFNALMEYSSIVVHFHYLRADLRNNLTKLLILPADSKVIIPATCFKRSEALQSTSKYFKEL